MKFVESSETSTDSGICNVAAVSMEEFVFTQDIRFNSSSCSGALTFQDQVMALGKRAV